METPAAGWTLMVFVYANPLKTASTVAFERSTVAQSESATASAGGDLEAISTARGAVLELFRQVSVADVNASASVRSAPAVVPWPAMERAMGEYLAAFAPFVGDELLSREVLYEWTQLLRPHGKKQIKASGSRFELGSMLLNYALFQAQESARVLLDVSPASADELHKRAYHLVQGAAGVLDVVDKEAASQLDASDEARGLDLHPEVVDALRTIMLAHAQEITIARGVLKGNSKGLLAQLAAWVAGAFQSTWLALKPFDFPVMDRTEAAKLRYYLKAKGLLWTAGARHLEGLHLLESNKCGPAIAHFQQALRELGQTDELVKYHCEREPKSKIKAVRVTFDGLRAEIERDLKRAKRENEVIYFDRVPDDPPELPEQKQLAKGTPFELPRAQATTDDPATAL